MPSAGRIDRKLRLALDRLNLSRGALAQRVGVDKSVVHRWVAGTIRPNDNSLVAITAVVREQVDAFSKADWNLSDEAFASKIGSSAIEPEAATAASGPLAATLARAAANRADAARYAGLWLVLYPSIQARLGEFLVRGTACAILDEPPLPRCLIGDGPDGFWTGGGPVLPLGDKLCLLLERLPAADALAMVTFWGVPSGQPAVLDGLCLSRAGNARGTPSAIRYVALRLAPAAPDPTLEQARWQGLAAALAGRRHELADAMPGALLDHLRGGAATAPDPIALRSPLELSLSGSEYEVSETDRPESPRRVALEAARRLFPVGEPA